MFSEREELQTSTPKYVKYGSPAFGSPIVQRISTDRESGHHDRSQNSKHPAYYAQNEGSVRSPNSPYNYGYRQEQHLPPRQGSNMITGLRTELMNIKSEVSRMIVPRSNDATPQQYRCDRSQASSTSSVSESVDRCTRNLKAKVSVKDKFVEMEVESLQAEVKALKRKYQSKKEEHQDEVQRLNRKIQIMQQLLQENETKIEEYKADINEELKQIQMQMVNNPNERALTEQEVETLRLEICELEDKLLKAAEADRLSSKTYEAEIERLRGQLNLISEEKDIELQRLQEQKQQLVSRIEKAETEQVSSQKLNQLKLEYEARLEQLQQSHTSELKSKQDSLQQQIDISNAQLQGLQKKLERATSEVEEKDVVLIAKGAELAEKELIITQLEQKISEMQSTKSQLNAEEQANYQLCEKLMERESEIQSLKKAAAEKAVELEKIQGCLSEIAGKCEIIYATSEELSAQKEQLAEQLAQLRQQLEMRTTECQQLTYALQEREGQLQQASQEDLAVVEQFKVRLVTLAEDQQRLSQEMQSKCEQSECQQNEIKHLAGLYNESLQLLKRKDTELQEVHYQYESRLKEYELQIQAGNAQLQQQDIEYRSVVDSLRAEINHLQSSQSNNRNEIRQFDDALHEQIEENKRLKDTISKKTDELYKVREQSTMMRSQFDQLKSHTEIEKLKWLAERKNIHVNQEVEVQNLRNQLDAERRTGESLNSKFRFLVDEIKKKDEFIQKHIVQRRLAPEEKDKLEQFFEQYRLDFPADKIKDKLNAELNEIVVLEKNNRNLLSELCSLRQQLQQEKALKVEQTTNFTISQHTMVYPQEQVVDLDEQPSLDQPKEDLNSSKEPTLHSCDHLVELEPKKLPSFNLDAMDMRLTDETASLIGMDSSTDPAAEFELVDYE